MADDWFGLELVEFPTDCWDKSPRNPGPMPSAVPTNNREGMIMLGKIAGALLGERIAGRNSGAKGALIGAGVAAVARRGFGPLAGALALGWGAKKVWQWRKGRNPGFPADATPARPSSQTRTPS